MVYIPQNHLHRDTAISIQDISGLPLRVCARRDRRVGHFDERTWAGLTNAIQAALDLETATATAEVGVGALGRPERL